LRIEREGIEKLSDRYQYKVPQQKRYKGDTFVTTFSVTATCNCIRGTWDVDVRVIVVDNCALTRTAQFIVEPPEEKKDSGLLGMGLILPICGILSIAILRKRAQKRI
jgi:hypothetical protein